MKNAKESVRQAAKDTGKRATDQELFNKVAGLGEAFKSVVGKSVGFSKETAEGIYSQAYLLYNTGRYKEAADIFHLLTTLNPTEPKYIMGLAACAHMSKEYAKASTLYSLVSIIDPQNPIPFFHSSDCYIQVNDKVGASAMLEMAIKRAEGKPEFSTLKKRSEITLESLKKELVGK